MDGDDTARFIYLSLLGCALVFWFFTQNRQSLGKTVQMIAAWVFIFAGVIAVVGLWEDIRGTIAPGQRMTVSDSQIEVPRAADGHYYLQLMINDTPVDFLVDTGASQMVLTAQDAARIGINPSDLNYFGRAMTANGEVRTAPVKLEQVELGPFSDSGVSAWVNEGQMEQSLLGMGYLQRWPSIEISGGALVLKR
ncbi:MAG: TIGR02281 family clan AA aspartic protease [Pseudomonadota bacterium]